MTVSVLGFTVTVTRAMTWLEEEPDWYVPLRGPGPDKLLEESRSRGDLLRETHGF